MVLCSIVVAQEYSTLLVAGWHDAANVLASDGLLSLAHNLNSFIINNIRLSQSDQDLASFLSTYCRMPPFLKYSISTSVSNLTLAWKLFPSLVVTLMISCTPKLPPFRSMLNDSFPVKPKYTQLYLLIRRLHWAGIPGARFPFLPSCFCGFSRKIVQSQL